MVNPAENTAFMVLSNHIYEYKKGVRNLVLYTLRREYVEDAVKRLSKLGIDHVVQDISGKNANIYFGRKECIEVIKGFITRQLQELTPEEDFILGALLGYDLRQECERYCERKG